MLDLMKLHVDALYTHNSAERMVAVNQWDGGMAPRFFLGRTANGNFWRFRSDLSDELAASLVDLCADEPPLEMPGRHPLLQARYLELLSEHAEVERVWSGPAFWIPRGPAPEVDVVAISAQNAGLLHDGFEEWLEDVPHRQPFLVVVEEGRAVSLCASVRITERAHEAGVETLADFRGKGLAARVVAGWVEAVQQAGALPLYSTSWENTASQSVAAKLGAVCYGVDFHIT